MVIINIITEKLKTEMVTMVPQLLVNLFINTQHSFLQLFTTFSPSYFTVTENKIKQKKKKKSHEE